MRTARQSVPRLPQDQPAGGRCRPGGGAVARGENIRHRAGVPLPEPDLQQRAGEDAHHVVQKAVARECQAHFLAQPLDGDGIDRAHGGFFHAPVGAKRRVVARAAQQRGRALHGRRVERLRQSVDIPALEHVRRFTVPDAVDIRLAAAGQTRVKARRGFIERQHADIPRQARTQLAQQLRCGQRGLCAERCRLHPRVHARIRAAGARDLDRLAEQVAEHGLEPPLNGVRRVALPLPAVVARAVIAERHAEIRHSAPPLVISRKKHGPAGAGPCVYVLCRLRLRRLLAGLAEVQFLEPLDLVAHGLEAAARAVEILGHALEDGVHGLGHVVDLLGRVVQGLEVDILRDEDHAHVRDVRVFLILLDEVAADLVERNALLDGLLAHADLLAAALGRDAHHVPVREDVVLHELDVADGSVGRVLILDVDVLNAEDHEAGKRHVALDLLHIRAVEQHLVRRDQAAVGRDAGEVHGVVRAAAEFIRGVAQQHEFALAVVLPRIALFVGPLLRRCAEQIGRFANKAVVQFHILHVVPSSKNAQVVQRLVDADHNVGVLRQLEHALAVDVVGGVDRIGGDVGEHIHPIEFDEIVHARVDHAVDDHADALIGDEIVGRFLDLAADVHALGALVGDEDEVRDLLHDAAADLLDAGLTVDDHVVKVIGEHADDFLEVGVDRAVAPGCLRTADGQKGEAVALDHGVKDAEARLVEHLDGLAVLAALRGLDDFVADVVDRVLDMDAQRRGQADGRVCVDGEDALAGEGLHQLADDRRAQRGLADAALAGDCDDLGFRFVFFHSAFPPDG